MSAPTPKRIALLVTALMVVSAVALILSASDYEGQDGAETTEDPVTEVWTDAKAVIFDEPTSSLDIKGSKDVANLIGKLRDMGKAILVSLHDIELSHAIGDEFHLLCRKSFICSGGKETLTKENLERTYETPIALIKQGDELFVSYRKGE